MATADTTRTARVEARIAPEALAVVRRAAELQGRSVSDFLVAAALKDAQRTIEDAQIIRLSVDDQVLSTSEWSSLFFDHGFHRGHG